MSETKPPARRLGPLTCKATNKDIAAIVTELRKLAATRQV